MEKFLNLNGLQRVIGKMNLRLDRKQEKLTGLPGQFVGFGPEGAAAVTIRAGDNVELSYDSIGLTVNAAVGNLNLLDNWYFADPVNQRGIAAWTEGYGIDRWYSEGLSAALGEHGLDLERTGSAIAFIQRWEPERVRSLLGKTLTLSLLMPEGISYCTFQITRHENGNYQSSVRNHSALPGLECCMPLLNYSNGDCQMARIVPVHNKCVTLIAAKLELGLGQTLARQDTAGNWVLNDPPPNRVMETLKCQRYYRVFSTRDPHLLKAGDFHPPMRIDPTFGTIEIDGEAHCFADANL